MSYKQTLIAAGAKVIEFKTVGSYQGQWGAIVEQNGTRALVVGYYGSCSGCDRFQAEFDYGTQPEEDNGKYYKGYSWDEDNEITKEQFDEEMAKYNQRLADFGQSYLKTPFYKYDIERKLASFSDEDWFDSEEKELYDWAITFFTT